LTLTLISASSARLASSANGGRNEDDGTRGVLDSAAAAAAAGGVNVVNGVGVGVGVGGEGGAAPRASAMTGEAMSGRESRIQARPINK
jgi:hypothetical protein